MRFYDLKIDCAWQVLKAARGQEGAHLLAHSRSRKTSDSTICSEFACVNMCHRINMLSEGNKIKSLALSRVSSACLRARYDTVIQLASERASKRDRIN
jgi:hypothetical protein